MKKFRLTVTIEDYWDYVVEAENEDEAREQAMVDFKEGLDFIDWPTVDVTQVPDDIPLGDV